VFFRTRSRAREVSIRAPRSSAGRRVKIASFAAIASFQSAPRVLLRGDSHASCPHSWQSSFNPRPAFFCGATTLTCVLPMIIPGFNPRPAFFCGATVQQMKNAIYRQVSIRAPRSSAGRRRGQ